jgi:hypothetical protein
LNLLWIIFSMLLVECTLNFNHVDAVLGGPFDNELHLPAQLLPLLIGAFGFTRTSYLMFENFRSPGELEPSIIDPSPPQPARTMHFGPDVLQAFSPGMKRKRTSKEHSPDEIDELEGHRPWPIRYLVAWLPWLSLLKYFQDAQYRADERADEAGKGLRRGPTVGESVQLGNRNRTGRTSTSRHSSDDASAVDHVNGA